MSATDSLETMTVNKKQSLRRTESGSSVGTQVTGTQNANILDAARIERLLAVFNAIQSCKKQNEVLKVVLKELRSLIQFSNCTIFVFQPELIQQCALFRPDKDGVHVATLLFEGRQIKAISESENLAAPSFKKFDDIRYGLKNQIYLGQPVLFKDEEFMLIIQCESRVLKRQNKHMGF